MDGATAAKAEGATAFKRGDFDIAASLFARAIDLGAPEPHLLHSNRSAALEAAGKHAEALVAAEKAIALGGDTFVKGHYRRAVALAGLHLWADASVACAAGLAQPDGVGNTQLIELQQKCVQQLQVHQRQSNEQVPLAIWRSDEERKLAALDAAKKLELESNERHLRQDAEREERLQSERARVRLLEAELAERQHAEKEEALRRRREETESAKQRVSERVGMLHAGVAKQLDETALSDGCKSGAPDAVPQQARIAVESWRLKQMPTRQPLCAPRVPSDFMKQYAMLRKDSNALFEYLSLIQPIDCVNVFKPEIPIEVLVGCADAIGAHVTTEKLDWCIDWLQVEMMKRLLLIQALTKVGRFDMTILMLDNAAQARINKMFQALSSLVVDESHNTVHADLKKLHQKFLGRN